MLIAKQLFPALDGIGVKGDNLKVLGPFLVTLFSDNYTVHDWERLQALTRMLTLRVFCFCERT